MPSTTGGEGLMNGLMSMTGEILCLDVAVCLTQLLSSGVK